MTIKNFKYIEVEAKQEELIIQANNGELIMDVFKSLIHSPKSKKEIAVIFNIDQRQADYYTAALAAMGLTAIYDYCSKNIIGLNEVGVELSKDISSRKMADYLQEIDFLENQKQQLHNSDLAKSTKERRMQSIEAISNWIEKVNNEKI